MVDGRPHLTTRNRSLDRGSSGGPDGDVRVQRFTVSFEYSVRFTREVFSPENPALAATLAGREPSRRHRVFAVVDSGVARAWPSLASDIERYVLRHGQVLELASPPEVVEGGEAAKNDPDAVRRLQGRLHALGMDRQSFVLVVGGGAVQDMAGYAAATAHRGLRVVRVPTTVLSQNDGGVGVKNGINAFGTKNFLGTFSPPFAVLNDASFLTTLPARERVAGFAEAVKVALIRDAAFFEWLSEHAGALAAFEPAAIESMIRRCAELHLEHIATSGDPFEFGSARPLDFGHWSAHKLESLTSHTLRHGEAVAIGMALDSRYSAEIGLLPEGDVQAICGLLERLGLPLWDRSLLGRDSQGRLLVLAGLDEFRQHLGGELTLTMLEGIGRAVEVRDVLEDALLRSLGWLEERGSRS